VLHKCANPACPTTFLKLSQGKLFLMETDPIERAESRRTNWRDQVSHRVEYFWLCDRCAVVFTLFYEKGCGIVTVARNNAARKPQATAERPADVALPGNGRTEQSA
jgi:hypothetical protein